MSLRDELTADNVYSYVQVCVDVANYLSTLQAEGRSTVVLPSRGAYPVYKTADHVRQYLGNVEHRWTVLPFTADDSQGVETAVARQHWVRVLAAESTGSTNANWDYFKNSSIPY